MSTSLLEMNHIKKEFDGLGVLKDISLSVEEGEIVSVSMLLIRILSLLLFIWEICGRHFNMSRVKSKPGAAWLFVTLNISTNLNI